MGKESQWQVRYLNDDVDCFLDAMMTVTMTVMMVRTKTVVVTVTVIVSDRGQLH